MNNKKALLLLKYIIDDMRYIKLLLIKAHKPIVPLNTYNLVMKKLYELGMILEHEEEGKNNEK